MKRAFLALAMAVVLVTVLAIPAFAATYDLGPFNAPGGHSYWFSDGTDNTSTGLTADILKNATEIQIEFTEEPTGDIQFVFMGDGNNWSWKQFDAIFGPEKGTSLSIKLSDYPDWAAAVSGEDGEVKIALGYWDGELSSIIKSATLVYSTSGGGGGGGAARTGDTTLIVLAITALTLAAGATVLIIRKIKA
ncbi:MAG: hypothetical protein LBI19_07195 [Oscillospiraceae bacterium]|jgi:hypothetical protein|nr:hypothetical protein [Oscillospiraceae bacterium]